MKCIASVKCIASNHGIPSINALHSKEKQTFYSSIKYSMFGDLFDNASYIRLLFPFLTYCSQCSPKNAGGGMGGY